MLWLEKIGFRDLAIKMGEGRVGLLTSRDKQ